MADRKAKDLKNLEKANTPEAKKKAAETRRRNIMVRTAVYDELKNRLLDEDGKGKAYYQKFMDKFLETALKYPDSKPAQTVADTIFQKELLSMLDAEHEKEMNRDKDFMNYRLMKQFYDRQREVMYEINHRRKIMCLTSRRTGKSTMDAGIIVSVASKGDSPVIYYNLTFQNGVKQIFDEVIKYSESIGLVTSRTSKADGTIEWTNGSSLKIFGNNNSAEADKARGFKARCVIIDEIGHQKNIDYLLNEVIIPLMADYADSTLVLTGTPSRVPHHFSTKIWEEDNTYQKYNWNLTENPYIPDAKAFIDEVCESKGLTIESPFIQREYFGKLVADIEALVFKGHKTFKIEDKDKAIKDLQMTDIAIGVDYGFTDYNSIISIAYNKHTKKSLVIEENKFNKAGVSDIISAIQKQYEHAKEMLEEKRINPEGHLAIYCDSNEESITADLMTKYKLPAFNCYKYDKMYAIEMLAEELRTGRMTVMEGGFLDNEMDRTLYARDDEDNVINELDEDAYHADAIMALLYASRKVFFDMDYDITFKESVPQTSDYKKTEGGTIIGFATPERTDIVGGTLETVG